MRTLLLWFFLFSSFQSFAQEKHPCYRILQNTQNAYQRNLIDQAFEELQNLDVCDTDDELLKERQSLQKKIFEAIKKQREEAEYNEKIAIQSKLKAQKYVNRIERSLSNLLALNLNRRMITAENNREKLNFYSYVKFFLEDDSVRTRAIDLYIAHANFAIENFQNTDLYLDQVLASDSLNIDALDIKCLIHLYSFAPSMSYEYGMRVLSIQPKRLNTLMNVGLALGHLGKYNESLDYINQSIENIDEFNRVNYYSLVLPELEEISMAYKLYMNKKEYLDHLFLYKIAINSFQNNYSFVESFSDFLNNNNVSFNTALVIMNLIEIQLINKKDDIGGLVLEGLLFEEIGFPTKAKKYFKKYLEESKVLQNDTLSKYCMDRVNLIDSQESESYLDINKEVFNSNEYTLVKAEELLWKWDALGALKAINDRLIIDSTDFRLYELKGIIFQNIDTLLVLHPFDSLLEISRILEERFPARKSQAHYFRAISFKSRYNLTGEELFNGIRMNSFLKAYSLNPRNPEIIKELVYFNVWNGKIASAYSYYRELLKLDPFNYSIPEMEDYLKGMQPYFDSDSIYIDEMIKAERKGLMKIDSTLSNISSDSVFFEKLFVSKNLIINYMLRTKNYDASLVLIDLFNDLKSINFEYKNLKIYWEIRALELINNFLTSGNNFFSTVQDLAISDLQIFETLCYYSYMHINKFETTQVYSKSLSELKDFLRSVPENTMGISSFLQKNPDSSIDVMKRGILKLSKEHPYNLVLKSNLSRIYNALGLEYRESRNNNEALEKFERAFSLAEEIHDSLFLLTCYSNVSLSLKELEEYDKALEKLDKGLTFATSYVGDESNAILILNFHKADCLLNLEREAEAVSIFGWIKNRLEERNDKFGKNLLIEIKKKGY